jgi:hypothetical protein
MDEHSEAEGQLRAEASGLGVDDILAVCYSFHQNRQPERLRFYLDLLRQRGGERAQFASCVICFDLARQGDVTAQREFSYLVDTIRTLAAKRELVEALIGGDPYLVYVWELCQAQLDSMDLRFADGGAAPAVEAVAALDLLTDADFAELPDFAGDVDDSHMWLRYDEAVEDFLGGTLGVPVYDPTAGFRLRNSHDVERIEAFLRELDSIRDFVRPSRGFRALVLLFYGTHLRSRSVFGAINQRKQEVLRAGITEFVESAPHMWEVAGVLGPIHSDPDVWEKVGDLLADYLQWMSEEPEKATRGPAAYDAVGRLLTRDTGRSPWRR